MVLLFSEAEAMYCAIDFHNFLKIYWPGFTFSFASASMFLSWLTKLMWVSGTLKLSFPKYCEYCAVLMWVLLVACLA